MNTADELTPTRFYGAECNKHKELKGLRLKNSGQCIWCSHELNTVVYTRSQTVMAAIMKEREFQDIKWGKISEGAGHSLAEWVLLIESEVEEAKVALIKGGRGRDSIMAEIIQVAAVCVAALEQHGTEEITERSV